MNRALAPTLGALCAGNIFWRTTLASADTDYTKDDISYQVGYTGEKLSEALPKAVPRSNINPQKCPYGLYAEQLSGTSFTTPRVSNRRTWMYRMLPACKHLPPQPYTQDLLVSDFSNAEIVPDQRRWSPLPMPKTKKTFVDGLVTYAGCGSAESNHGLAIHLYACNESMGNTSFGNSDGDFLIVPEQGKLHIKTECGRMTVDQGEICIIPRGIRFCIDVEGPSRGYVCETWGEHLVIPDLGPIGANGLANPRDFQVPNAHYEDVEGQTYTVIQKFSGKLFSYTQDHTPFDVVGWCGNYYPKKYDLAKYVTINSVSVDHIDPSIFTVLTCGSGKPGVALLDFVVFPPRWSVHTKTFRPPYYHRNCMSEFMGNIMGKYEAKEEGFLPGGASLHSPMMGHGPDVECFEKFSNCELNPVETPPNALAFMFESYLTLKLTPFAANNLVQENYYQCWQGLKNHFQTQEVCELL